MKDELTKSSTTQEKFFITGDEKGILLPFDRVFKREDVKLFNSLPLIKRIQINQTDLIVEDWQVIMSNDIKLYYKLLSLIFDIRIENKGADIEETLMKFIDDNPIIMERISNYIEENYTITLDKGGSANVNIELQVTDELNKTFLKAIMLMRFITPLVCLYEVENNITNFDFSNFSLSTSASLCFLANTFAFGITTPPPYFLVYSKLCFTHLLLLPIKN